MINTQSINLTQLESRILYNLFVKKLFYALFCALKIVIYPVINYILFTFVLNVLSLESVEKIQPKPLSRRGPGSE
jgi:hypothetical protein